MDQKSVQTTDAAEHEAGRAAVNAPMNSIIRKAAGRGTVTTEVSEEAVAGEAPPVPDFDAGARPEVTARQSVSGSMNDRLRADRLGIDPSFLPSHLRSR